MPKAARTRSDSPSNRTSTSHPYNSRRRSRARARNDAARNNRRRQRSRHIQNAYYLTRTSKKCWDVFDDFGITGGRFRGRTAAVRYLRREFGNSVNIVFLEDDSRIPGTPAGNAAVEQIASKTPWDQHNKSK